MIYYDYYPGYHSLVQIFLLQELQTFLHELINIQIVNESNIQEQSQSGASANEEEEWERLSEMLSRMQAPQVFILFILYHFY